MYWHVSKTNILQGISLDRLILNNLTYGSNWQFFDKPADYKQNSNPQYLAAHRLISKVDFNPSDRILDIGCGDGRITAEIADRVPKGKVAGIDISAKMIESASHNHIKDNLSFAIMDAEKISYVSQFEKVFSLCCLHWVKEQLLALHGIKNALVPKGTAILLIPLTNELDNHLETTVAKPKWKNYFINFINPRVKLTEAIYSELLERAGFEKKLFYTDVIVSEFNSRRDMELFLSVCLPQLKMLPESIHSEFLSDVVSLFNDTSRNDEKVLYKAPLLNVLAIKP